MSKINTEIIKNRCVLLITDLRKMSSEFAAYNGKVAQIEARAELTREYKDTQIADEQQRLDASVRAIFTDMYEDVAMDYYSVADDLASQTDNPRVKGFVASSTGNAYEKFDEPQQALKSYSKAVKHYSDAEAPLKVAQNYSKAADIMVEFSNVSKAKSLLSKAQSYARQTDDVNLMNEIREKLSNLELLG